MAPSTEYWLPEPSFSDMSSIFEYSPESLAYVNSQLVAHGFARSPGISLIGLETKDTEAVVKCFLSLLSQRVDDMARCERLTTRLNTLSYDNTRINSLLASAIAETAAAERNAAAFASKLSNAQKALGDSEAAHKVTKEDMNKAKIALVGVRATHVAETKRREAEMGKFMERWGKVANEQTKLGSSVGAGMVCANLTPAQGDITKENDFRDVALRQAEQARISLVKEINSLKDVLVGCANALAVLKLTSEDGPDEPLVISHDDLFAPPPLSSGDTSSSAGGTPASSAQSRLRCLFADLQARMRSPSSSLSSSPSSPTGSTFPSSQLSATEVRRQREKARRQQEEAAYKDEIIAQKERDLAQRVEELAHKDVELEQRVEEVSSRDEDLGRKDEEISRLRDAIHLLEIELQRERWGKEESDNSSSSHSPPPSPLDAQSAWVVGSKQVCLNVVPPKAKPAPDSQTLLDAVSSRASNQPADTSTSPPSSPPVTSRPSPPISVVPSSTLLKSSVTTQRSAELSSKAPTSSSKAPKVSSTAKSSATSKSKGTKLSHARPTTTSTLSKTTSAVPSKKASSASEKRRASSPSPSSSPPVSRQTSSRKPRPTLPPPIAIPAISITPPGSPDSYELPEMSDLTDLGLSTIHEESRASSTRTRGGTVSVHERAPLASAYPVTQTYPSLPLPLLTHAQRKPSSSTAERVPVLPTSLSFPAVSSAPPPSSAQPLPSSSSIVTLPTAKTRLAKNPKTPVSRVPGILKTPHRRNIFGVGSPGAGGGTTPQRYGSSPHRYAPVVPSPLSRIVMMAGDSPESPPTSPRKVKKGEEVAKSPPRSRVSSKPSFEAIIDESFEEEGAERGPVVLGDVKANTRRVRVVEPEPEDTSSSSLDYHERDHSRDTSSDSLSPYAGYATSSTMERSLSPLTRIMALEDSPSLMPPAGTPSSFPGLLGPGMLMVKELFGGASPGFGVTSLSAVVAAPVVIPTPVATIAASQGFSVDTNANPVGEEKDMVKKTGAPAAVQTRRVSPESSPLQEKLERNASVHPKKFSLDAADKKRTTAGSSAALAGAVGRVSSRREKENVVPSGGMKTSKSSAAPTATSAAPVSKPTASGVTVGKNKPIRPPARAATSVPLLPTTAASQEAGRRVTSAPVSIITRKTSASSLGGAAHSGSAGSATAAGGPSTTRRKTGAAGGWRG